MARKRNQRTGHLREKCGSWLFQWRETVIGKDGRPVRKIFAKTIAPARGRDGLSKREAQRIAKVTILDKLDETEIRPSTLMTVAEFYRRTSSLSGSGRCGPAASGTTRSPGRRSSWQ